MLTRYRNGNLGTFWCIIVIFLHIVLPPRTLFALVSNKIESKVRKRKRFYSRHCKAAHTWATNYIIFVKKDFCTLIIHKQFLKNKGFIKNIKVFKPHSIYFFRNQKSKLLEKVCFHHQRFMPEIDMKEIIECHLHFIL